MKRVGTGAACSVLLVLLFGCPTWLDSVDEKKNRAPRVAITPTSAAVANGVGHTFATEASDPDGDTLTYS